MPNPDNAPKVGKVETVEQARNAIYECSKELGIAAIFDLLAHSIANASTALAASHAKGVEEGRRECRWEDTSDGEGDPFYETQCNHEWAFLDGGIVENSVKFCPFCGGTIAALPSPGEKGKP